MKSLATTVMYGTRLPPSVAKKLEARAKKERRSVSSVIAILVEDGLDRPPGILAGSTLSQEPTPELDLSPVEREFLVVLDQALSIHGIVIDRRRVVRQREFRKLYNEVRNTTNIVLATQRKLVVAKRVVGSDETRIWRN
jgi:hypothetical protein